MDDLIIRPIVESDWPFVIASWRNNVYYNLPRPRPSSVEWFRQKTREIQAELMTSRGLIACMEDVLIGYVVNDFMYVKRDYRNMGVEECLKNKNH